VQQAYIYLNHLKEIWTAKTQKGADAADAPRVPALLLRKNPHFKKLATQP